MQKVISDMLLDIAQGRSGYSIGEPWRFTEHSLAAIVPLIRESKGRERLYRLFSERKKEVKVRDTGNIERLTLTSVSEFPILVKAGEVVVGGTQSRTITLSQVLMPREKLTVPCACVYSSKGIMEGQGMTPSTYSPSEVRRRVYRGHYGKRFGPSWGGLTSHYYRDQGAIWEGVNTSSKKMMASTRSLMAYAASRHDEPELASLVDKLDLTYHSPSEDLAGRVSESQTKYQDILKKIPKAEGQVGMVLLTITGMESLESFEHPDSWEGLRRAILGADSDKIADVSDQNGLFEFKAEKAREIIQEVLSKNFSEKVAVDRTVGTDVPRHTQTIILDTDNFTGEVVTLDDVPIHLALVKKES